MASKSGRESELPSLPPRRSKTGSGSGTKSMRAAKSAPKPKPTTVKFGLLCLVGAIILAVPLLAWGLWAMWPIEIASRDELETAQPKANKDPGEVTFVKVEGNIVQAEREYWGGKMMISVIIEPQHLPRWVSVKPGMKFRVRFVEGPGTINTYRGDRLIDWETAANPKPGSIGPVTITDDGRTRKVYIPGGSDGYPIDANSFLPPADPQAWADYQQAIAARNQAKAVVEAASNHTDDQGPPENTETALLLALCWPERADLIAAAKLPAEVEPLYKRSLLETRVKVAGWLKDRPDVQPSEYLPGVLAVFNGESAVAPADSMLTSACQFLDALPPDELVKLLLTEQAEKIPLSLQRIVNHQQRLRVPNDAADWLAKVLADPRAEPFVTKYIQKSRD